MAENRQVIGVSSAAGDPRSPGTWSGTPCNIIKALEHEGNTVIGISADLNRYQKVLCNFLHRALGLGIDYRRGALARNLSARIVQNQANGFGCDKVLHTGTFDLPVGKSYGKRHHYLFCDTTWDLWSQDTTKISRYSPRMVFLSERLEKKSYSQIKHFFSVSRYVQDNLLHHYGVDQRQITVVRTGRGKIQPFMGEKDYRSGPILFVAKGRFEDKGGPLLLEGFRIALRTYPHLKLIVVGGEDYRDLLPSVPNVTLMGYIPWDELQHLFNTAALFAMPAINEPWGLAYLDALACRTPVLGLNRNSLPEITVQGKYGFLVEKPRPEHIAEAIVLAFSAPEQLGKMGLEGQKYCLETFSWEKTGSKIATVISGRNS